jgi:hypothetical protein
MIKETNGNLLKANVEALADAVNCLGITSNPIADGGMRIAE